MVSSQTKRIFYKNKIFKIRQFGTQFKISVAKRWKLFWIIPTFYIYKDVFELQNYYSGLKWPVVMKFNTIQECETFIIQNSEYIEENGEYMRSLIVKFNKTR